MRDKFHQSVFFIVSIRFIKFEWDDSESYARVHVGYVFGYHYFKQIREYGDVGKWVSSMTEMMPAQGPISNTFKLLKF